MPGNKVNHPYSNLQFTDLQFTLCRWGMVSFLDFSTLWDFSDEAKPFLTIQPSNPAPCFIDSAIANSTFQIPLPVVIHHAKKVIVKKVLVTK